jgi:hypothetical protein
VEKNLPAMMAEAAKRAKNMEKRAIRKGLVVREGE